MSKRLIKQTSKQKNLHMHLYTHGIYIAGMPYADLHAQWSALEAALCLLKQFLPYHKFWTQNKKANPSPTVRLKQSRQPLMCLSRPPVLPSKRMTLGNSQSVFW